MHDTREKTCCNVKYRIGVCIWLGLLLCSNAFSKTGGSVRLQAAQQYDSNSARISGNETAGDFLTRVLIKGQLFFEKNQHTLWARLQEGGKIFYHHEQEDQIVSAFYAGYRFGWGQNSSGIKINLRDMTQYHHTRDYFQVSAAAFLSFELRPSVSMEILTGARHYTFKPDPVPIGEDKYTRFTNTGPMAQLRLDARLDENWSINVSYGLGIRFFNDVAYEFIQESLPDASLCHDEQGCLLPTGFERVDYNHSLGLSIKLSANWFLQYVMMAKVSYLATFNDSNSTGSTAIWHRMRAVLSLQLPLDLTLHLMGTFQLTDYPDGINLLFDLYEPDADENENSAVVRLTWRFAAKFQLVLEGALYRGAMALGDVGNADFSRQTLLMGLAWGWQH